MTDHGASVVVAAPVAAVFKLFSHFNDFPKFMSFVREVTYLDTHASHWVVDVFGRHEWDAVNEGWETGRRIGWHSTDGLQNRGCVEFTELEPARTRVDVRIAIEPPAGLLGKLGEALGAGREFERRLQHDLTHFAQMVEAAPPGSLDPASSSYLFHGESAAAQGLLTDAQRQTMGEPFPANRDVEGRQTPPD